MPQSAATQSGPYDCLVRTRLLLNTAGSPWHYASSKTEAVYLKALTLMCIRDK